MRRIYSFLWWLAMPLVGARLWWRGRTESGYRQHLGERFGFFSPCRRSAPLIWIHAVSLGETRAAEPLIDALLDAYPHIDLLLTHMTPTGRAAGAEIVARHGTRVQQSWLPYDTGWMVKRFLKVFSPRLCLLMETEIWPNLMHGCSQQAVPVVLVNARLSARSLKKAQRLGSFMRDAVLQLDRVGAQTEADAGRMRLLGVDRITVTGSMKFDRVPTAKALQRGATWRRQIGERPVLLCASTRAGEEALLLDALAAADLPESTLIIIVPRHPQRFDQVAALIAQTGPTLQRSSTLGDQAVDADILLGDTMGDMFAYCAASDLVWVGGSLLPLGGQNPIEACALGKPVLLGPHTFNFAEVSEQAIEAGAAIRVDDAARLMQVAGTLLRDETLRQSMGHHAAQFALHHRGATSRTMALIAPLVDAAART